MLKKLLRYDLKSIFKYWWIAAVSSVGLSLLGAMCVAALTSGKRLPELVTVAAIFALVIIVLSFFAVSILTTILIFARFYKNFFTDEGYLTFTLPVKRSQLLNSKLIMSIAANIATALLFAVDILLIVFLGAGKNLFTSEVWEEFTRGLTEFFAELGFYAVIYAVEYIALFVLQMVFSTLFMFCCITFASIITKRARVITAIGIYYGVNAVISFVYQIFRIFANDYLSMMTSSLPDDMQKLMLVLMLLCCILFAAVFCGLIYALQYRMLDRKLNLA